MTQTPNQPSRPTSNPCASVGNRPGSAAPPPSGTPAPVSRFGSAPQAAPAATQPATPPPAPPRPTGLAARIGPTKMNWRTVPLSTYLVRFDLQGLGDPFYRLLGKPLSIDFGDQEAVIKALEANTPEVTEMVDKLDAAWGGYDFKGAMLFYPWRKDLRLTLIGQVINETDDDEELPQVEYFDDDKRTPPKVLRSLDLWLVLNVLARTRSNILLPDSPLALEQQYLGQSLYTDDPRLLTLTQATGWIEEPLK